MPVPSTSTEQSQTQMTYYAPARIQRMKRPPFRGEINAIRKRESIGRDRSTILRRRCRGGGWRGVTSGLAGGAALAGIPGEPRNMDCQRLPAIFEFPHCTHLGPDTAANGTGRPPNFAAVPRVANRPLRLNRGTGECQRGDEQILRSLHSPTMGQNTARGNRGSYRYGSDVLAGRVPPAAQITVC